MYLTEGISFVTPEQLDQLCALQRAGELPGLDWLFRKIDSCRSLERGSVIFNWQNFVRTPPFDAVSRQQDGDTDGAA